MARGVRCALSTVDSDGAGRDRPVIRVERTTPSQYRRFVRRQDTGFPTADAQDDFQRARRRHVLSRLARRVAREPGDVDVILPFDEVVEALGRVERALRRPGDDRARPHRRHRRPRARLRPPVPPDHVRVRVRWERIANAARRGEPLPPISVYRLGEVALRARRPPPRVGGPRARARHDRRLRRRGGNARRRRALAARRRPAAQEPRAAVPRARPAARPRAPPHRPQRPVGLRRAGRERRGLGLPRRAGPRASSSTARRPPGAGSTRSTRRPSSCCARPT